jgi:hypothetical protein
VSLNGGTVTGTDEISVLRNGLSSIYIGTATSGGVTKEIKKHPLLFT